MINLNLFKKFSPFCIFLLKREEKKVLQGILIQRSSFAFLQARLISDLQNWKSAIRIHGKKMFAKRVFIGVWKIHGEK